VFEDRIAVLGGHGQNGIGRNHHLVARVDKVEHRVRDGDVERHAGNHNGGNPLVAKQAVQFGARGGGQPVEPWQQYVGLRGVAHLVDGLRGPGTRVLLDSCIAGRAEQSGVATGPPPVGADHGQAVDNPHPGCPGRRGQLAEGGTEPAGRRLGQGREAGIRPDNAVLALDE
ncbi:uncharacterized protein METZ01_LOCUS130132, partial [marine metagenome]